MAKKILIVDDDPDMVQMLQLAFGRAGYLTHTATDGKEAISKVNTSPPDLVLLDVMLPEVNGFTVCENLRGQSALAPVPIILMTALPGDFPRLVAAEAGATFFLNKPFHVDELLAQVDSLLSSSGAQSTFRKNNLATAIRPSASR